MDKILEEADPFLGRYTLTVFCHGATERVELHESDTIRELGVAFLPEGPPRLTG